MTSPVLKVLGEKHWKLAFDFPVPVPADVGLDLYLEDLEARFTLCASHLHVKVTSA